MTRPLSIAHLSAIDLPPPQFIRAAGAAGFDGVGLRLIRVTDTSPGYPLWADPQMLRDTKAAMDETGVTVGDIEFVKVTPELTVQSLIPFFEVGAELGAKHAILAPYDPDLSRLSDKLAEIAEIAEQHGMGTVLEFFPWTEVPDLQTCWRVVQNAGPKVGMLVDSLHFDRSGSTYDALKDVPKERLPFIHLCDADRQDSYSTEKLLHTAREDRHAPGDGQIDLLQFVQAFSPDTPVALEIPRPGHMDFDSAVTAFTDYAAKTRRLLEQANG